MHPILWKMTSILWNWFPLISDVTILSKFVICKERYKNCDVIGGKKINLYSIDKDESILHQVYGYNQTDQISKKKKFQENHLRIWLLIPKLAYRTFKPFQKQQFFKISQALRVLQTWTAQTTIPVPIIFLPLCRHNWISVTRHEIPQQIPVL